MTDINVYLIEIASQLSHKIADDAESWRSFVVRAFLWSSWQRCQMIYFHSAAGDCLSGGSPDGKKVMLTMRGMFPSPETSIHEMSQQRASLQKAPYMCGWNFEVIRNNPVCIGADFRRFHQRYTATFGDHPARCLAKQVTSCAGDTPRSCRRFQSMVIGDQPAHDETCARNCKRLVWDETCYRSIVGARAISIAPKNNHLFTELQYCNASGRTLAISHVWSQ